MTKVIDLSDPEAFDDLPPDGPVSITVAPPADGPIVHYLTAEGERISVAMRWTGKELTATLPAGAHLTGLTFIGKDVIVCDRT